MKKQLSILAMLALPACMGGGSDSGVDLTPSSPDVAMNNDFGALLNGVRVNDASYDARLGRAAQIHANDMVDRDYLSVTIPGTVGNNNGMQDIGDLITAQGYTWADLAQLVEQGEYTLAEVLTEFQSVDCGNAGQDLCLEDSTFTDFGIAKAGAGVDQKWVLVLTAQ